LGRECFVFLVLFSYYVTGSENESARADDCPGSVQSSSDKVSTPAGLIFL